MSVRYDWNFLLTPAFLSLNLWITFLFEWFLWFGWKKHCWKAIMLLLSNVTRLTTFSVIFVLTSAVFHRFQEKYVIRHHSTPFKPIWFFGILISHKWVMSICISQKAKNLWRKGMVITTYFLIAHNTTQ